MTYVEWLRVRNCLRTLAIVLGILVFLAIVLRVSLARYISPEEWVHHIALDPGASETHLTLPDGTKRSIIEDPTERTHVVIDDRGNAGTHIVITEPSSRAHKDSSHVSVGSIQVSSSNHGSVTTTTIDTNGAVPLIYYMALADVAALIIATMLAAPLAREIDGHLEIALTKPVSRVRYALGAVGADVTGIVAASVMTIIACYLCEVLFGTYRLDFSGINARAIAMGIAMPVAWYALLCAATTWFNRSYGAVLGFAWPVAILLGVLAAIHPTNTVGLFVHDLGWVLSRLDPLSYVSFGVPNDHGTVDYMGANFAMRLGIEVVLFGAYIALALLRWERVEA